MARYLVTTKITGATDAGGNTVEYRKGTVVELTAAQVSALGAGNFRLANSPGGTVTTTYIGGATSTLGFNPASGTHDTEGLAAGASN